MFCEVDRAVVFRVRREGIYHDIEDDVLGGMVRCETRGLLADCWMELLDGLLRSKTACV